MAYDEHLATRVRTVLQNRGKVVEKRMFGGVAFMVSGHMCCGVIKEDLVLRLDPDVAAKAIRDGRARPMDFTGRPMKGFVYVSPDRINTKRALTRWVDKAERFVERLPPKRRP